MNEGTKLGEKQDNELGIDEFKPENSDDLKATKIGDVSEFEKSLFDKDVKESADKAKKTSEKVDKKEKPLTAEEISKKARTIT